MTNTENLLHAHYDTFAVDCDGPLYRSWIMTMNEDERASEYGDIDFHNRVTGSVVNTYSSEWGGTLDVNRWDDGSVSLEWSERTDEGHRHVTARICSDDCDTGETFYRDVFAEQAGY